MLWCIDASSFIDINWFLIKNYDFVKRWLHFGDPITTAVFVVGN
jgi:hypothetical protein